VTGWNGTTLTINPTGNLAYSSSYYIKIASTAIKDTAGNLYSGISDATTLNFTTAAGDGSVTVGTYYAVPAGNDVVSLADVNGDGYGDYVVNGGTTKFVVYGNSSGTGLNLSTGPFTATDGFKITTYNATDLVSGAGDFNGDGLADVIATSNGKYFIVYGNSTGTPVNLSSASPTIASTLGYALQYGVASPVKLTGAGDINGDGIPDFISIDTNHVVSVVFGATSGTLPSVTGFQINGIQNKGGFYPISGAGDVNGDGLADVILTDNSSNNVYVVYGKTSGTAVSVGNSIQLSNGFCVLGGSLSAGVGLAVSSAGDVNGDGLADVLIGDYSTTYDDYYSAWVVYELM
jgi:hypothetical protein